MKKMVVNEYWWLMVIDDHGDKWWLMLINIFNNVGRWLMVNVGRWLYDGCVGFI